MYWVRRHFVVLVVFAFIPHTSLEHYFEMSKIDAQEALQIYRHFCKETERVVEYLGVAKKLQNLLNVPIPNLRHVSLHSYSFHACPH